MRITTLLVSTLITGAACAEHLPGGNITYTCLGNNQYEVTLQLWRDCASASPMIDQGIDFANDCGVAFSLPTIPLIAVDDVSPGCPDQVGETTCNGGTLIGIQRYTYRTTLFLSPCNKWTISWYTCCRAPSVNLVLTQGTYIEALVNNAGGTCVTSPSFSEDQLPFACVGQPMSYDLGVSAGSGAGLRYHLIAARRKTPDVVPVEYQDPYSGTEPFTGMELDSLTGNLTFTPTLQGNVVVVVRVDMYDANGSWTGSVMRDFPFAVLVCTNNLPDAASGTVAVTQGEAEVVSPYEVSTCSSLPLCMQMVINDVDAGQELTLESNVGTVLPGATFDVSGSNPATVSICWDPAGAPMGTRVFSITATDDACPVVGAQTYTYALNMVQGANAGVDATAELCPEFSIDLSDLVTGDAGGVWSEGPVVGQPGEYTYTVTTSCGSDVAVFTVIPATTPDAGADSSVTICEGTSVDLRDLLTGSLGGTWSSGSSVVSHEGTYTYTVTNACGAADEALFTVSLIPPPNAGLPGEVGICPNAPAFAMIDSLGGTPEPGGEWSYDGSLHGPDFDPAVDPPGVYCYVVTGSVCASPSICLTVGFLPMTDPYCIFLGTPVLEEHGFSVRPNPTNGTLQVSGWASPATLEVLDMQGRVQWYWPGTTSVPTTALELPSTLANGIYVMRVRVYGGTWMSARFELLR